MGDSPGESPPPEKKLKSSSQPSLTPILNQSLSSSEIQVINVYTAQIRSKKDANNLLKLLTPLPPDLDHLKRIRSTKSSDSLEILIGHDDPVVPEDDDNPILGLLVPSSIQKAPVPKFRPLTSFQSKKSNEYWPCNFHPDKDVEKLVSQNCGFSVEEMESITNNVETVMTRFTQMKLQSCAVYDPNDKELVCIANSTSSLLKHSVMNCLEMLADTQKKADEETACDRKYDSGEIVCKRIVRNKHSDYLCTGMDIFLSHEPCLMCAMALLHSRARRIYFVNDNLKNGGLSSVVKLHCLEGINHRFQVFKVTQ